MKVVDRGYSGDIVLARRIGTSSAAGDTNRWSPAVDILTPERFVFSLVSHPIPPFSERILKTAFILLATSDGLDRVRGRGIPTADPVHIIARPSFPRRRPRA